MRAAGLLLLLLPLGLGLPRHPRGGSRCPGEAPAPPGTHNETLGRGAGTSRAPDVAALVAVGGWLGAVLLCVRRFVRRSREETRLRYLRALPCGPQGRQEEEEEVLSSSPGGEAPPGLSQQLRWVRSSGHPWVPPRSPWIITVSSWITLDAPLITPGSLLGPC
ncbi:hypothetical protein DUI87_33221 [Hirundo rustica rustica]|uniref:Uncharacterized protein n=1 Tax=Hirundo rustica rustica TaxID=333673 RepID=A0A3M0INW8_HIRRU|nr:hypothetical protein DUI87_33221 [Hirundo rustica rustica]